MPVIKHTNLSGGVLRPELWGRTDIPKYSTHQARLENFYPTPTGQLVNRPGFRYVTETYGDSATPVRLVSMIFSTEQAYVLEFAPLAVRVIRNGALVQVAPGPTYEIATSYTSEDIASMKFAQAGDELWIVCPDKAPRAIARLAETNWQILDISFTRNVLAPTGLGYDSGYVPVTTSDTLGHVAKKWSWVVTAWSADKTDESPPSTAFTVNSICVYDDIPVLLKWNSVTGASQYSVYRGRNGQYGYIGTSTSTSFADDGQVPLLSDDPPINRNPFLPIASSGHGNPRVVSFHQGRSVFANTELLPEGVYLSQSGIFTNFDYALVSRDTDAIDLEIANPRYSEIRSVVSFKDSLLLFTVTNEIVLQGANGDPLDATSMPSQKVQSYWGSSTLDPIVIGNSVIWQLDGGYPFRDFFYDANREMWVGRDLSISSGVAQEAPITSWGFARNPDKVVWGCSSVDGKLYSMTYDTELDVYGWARHFFDGDEGGGICESVAVIPEYQDGIPYDVVYAVVKYPNKNIQGAHPAYTRTIQRLAPRQDYNPLYDDHIYLDCATTWSGVAEANGRSLLLTRTSGSDDFAIGDVFTVEADAAVFAASDVGDWIVFYPGSLKDRIKLKIDSYTSDTSVSATLVGGNLAATDTNSRGLYRLTEGGYDDASDWGFARWEFDTTLYDVIFANQTDAPLYARVDDRVQKLQVPSHDVSRGEAGQDTPGADTTAEPAVFAVFGVGYRQLVETLDLPFGGQPGGQDMTLNEKILKKAGIEMSRAWPSFLLGESEDERHLTRWIPEPYRTTGEYGPDTEDHTFTGLAYLSPISGWNKGGRMLLVNHDPFPVGISAIIREVDYGGT